MKIGTRIVIFSSLFLLLLPVSGVYFVNKVEQALLQGQEEAESMTASAIALVLKGYTGLFNVNKNAIYIYPAVPPISIDGYDEDWYPLQHDFTRYGNGKFSLLMESSKQYLYAYVKVNDKNIVYRDPRNIPLDTSDLIRIEYIGRDDKRHRLVIVTEGQGTVSAYAVHKDWTSAINGQSINEVYGVWRETTYGYDLELRLPVDWLEKNRRMSLSVVDVFGKNERYPDTIFSTRSGKDNRLNPLLFQSGEISRVIKNLGQSDSRICVVDRFRRIRAVIGGQKLYSSFCQHIEKINANLVESVLSGKKTRQVSHIPEGRDELIIAAKPVLDEGKVLGAILVGKNSHQVLAEQRNTLDEVMLVAVSVFFIIILSLLVFSYWLTFRINRLKKQTEMLIDDSGRFISEIQFSDINSKDEIGDLSRGFSTLLDKLNRYTGFLETVPRILRHEILNPVNTISVSLQVLKDKSSKNEIAVASSAIRKLELIVSSLTEAVNIDEALHQAEIQTFDIAVLLKEYVENSQQKHSDRRLVFHGTRSGIFIEGNDIRLVQLLDKIKDNALDFSLPETDILFQLDLYQANQLVIRIKNEGKEIGQQQLDGLFPGMASHREGKTEIPHLGLGLYVAHRIARFHHGSLHLTNRRDKQGVEVILLLPIVIQSGGSR